MNKKDFHADFNTVINSLPGGIMRNVAEHFSKKASTVRKWYNGMSAPDIISRKSIINYLHAEQKKQEVVDIVRDVIRDELKIEAEHYNRWYEEDGSISIEIKLKLRDEVIYSDYITLETH